MMKVVLLVALSLCAGAHAKTIVYLAPTGDDAAAGTVEQPLKSPAAALARVRRSRVAGESAEIVFAPGTYALTAPLTLSPDDSHLILRAADEGAGVVLSGGRELPPFEQADRGLWKCRVPTGFTFEQLWVNGVRAIRAKTPNAFYLHAATPAARETTRAFFAHPADIADIAKLPPDELKKVVVRHFHSWNSTQAHPLKVDATTGYVYETPSCWWPLFTWPEYEPRYVLENYFAALDAPGEWFLDEKASVLWYMPRPGEVLVASRAVAPMVNGFLTIAGDRANGRLVRDIALRNLAFEYAGYRLSPNGQFSRQADVDVPSTIAVVDAEDIAFEYCRIEHIASHGIHFDRGTVNARMTFCLVRDLGAGAVVIGEQYAPHTEPVGAPTARITVEDCILQSGGRIFAGSVGVWVGRASEIAIRHNDIGDFYYSGVSVGWTWGYVPTGVHDNDISHNHIHHVLQGVLSDGGGIYMLGDQPGTKVIGNRIHDVYSYDYQGRGSHGLYTDEGSAHMLFASNLVYRTKYGALHQHYGKENRFENNIFAFSRENMIIRTRMEKHHTLSFRNNIVYWDNDTLAVTGERQMPGVAKDVTFDGNLYWSTKGVGTNAFLGADFATWQRNGHDRHGAVADPKFADPANGDFTLAADSPALALGFKPFDYGAAGVRGSAAWRDEAARCKPPAVKTAPRPNPCKMEYRRLENDFEELGASGGKEPRLFDFAVGGAESGSWIRPTDKVTHGGRWALELKDSPKLSSNYMPHLYKHVTADAGKVRFSFAIRREKGADVRFFVRDYHPVKGSGFVDGPGVRFCDAAAGWRNVTLVVDFAARQWCVTIDGVAGPQKPFAENFNRMDWMGFTTDSSNDARWWLDDFVYTMEK